MNRHSAANGKGKAVEKAKSPKEQSEDASFGSRIASSAAGLAKELIGQPESATLAHYASAGTAGSSKPQPSASSLSQIGGSSSKFDRTSTKGYYSENSYQLTERFRSSRQNVGDGSEVRGFLSRYGLEGFIGHDDLPAHTWRNEFVDGGLERDLLQKTYQEPGIPEGGPVQYDDGAQVRALLSRTEFQIVDDPEHVKFQEPSEQTVKGLFPQNYNAEEQEVVNKIKATLPPPPQHRGVHPLNPINLIPRVEELTASLEDGEQSYLNYTTPQREQWLHEWESVLESYTDSVWGQEWESSRSNYRTVEETRSHLQEAAANRGPLDTKSVARLKMILGHIAQDSVTADLIEPRPNRTEERAAEDEDFAVPTFHCPWISCHQRFHNLIDLQRHSTTHQPFECPHTECGANFSQAQEWTEHISLAHHDLLDPEAVTREIDVES